MDIEWDRKMAEARIKHYKDMAEIYRLQAELYKGVLTGGIEPPEIPDIPDIHTSSKFKDAVLSGIGARQLSHLAERIHKNAQIHGWWETERSVPELLCLVHSEVSEALEAHRNGDNENLTEELADIIIRVCDMAVGLGIDIEEEVIKKHHVNIKRPYRHGGKKC